jgi:putative endopeptidase
MNMAYATQGGLGLPDTVYYFDPAKKENLADYKPTSRGSLELSGTPAADAAKQAKDVSRSKRAWPRCPSRAWSCSATWRCTTTRFAGRCRQGYAELLVGRLLQAQGMRHADDVLDADAEFHAEWNKMRSDVPVDQWKSYLRFHIVDEASPYLSTGFVQENFRFYARTCAARRK